MNDYYIRVTSDLIYASRILNGELEPLIIKGETFISHDVFWPSFKDKVEYETGEQFAFMIISDIESFEIDKDITIAEGFSCSDAELECLLFDNKRVNTYFYTYPKSKMLTDPEVTQIIDARHDADAVEYHENLDPNTDSLQTFFRKKTKTYKQETQMRKGK